MINDENIKNGFENTNITLKIVLENNNYIKIQTCLNESIDSVQKKIKESLDIKTTIYPALFYKKESLDGNLLISNIIKENENELELELELQLQIFVKCHDNITITIQLKNTSSINCLLNHLKEKRPDYFGDFRKLRKKDGSNVCDNKSLTLVECGIKNEEMLFLN